MDLFFSLIFYIAWFEQFNGNNSIHMLPTSRSLGVNEPLMCGSGINPNQNIGHVNNIRS